MSFKKKSASDKFLELINPTPVHFDPEADIHTETAAKVIANDYDEEFSDDEVISRFRKQNAELLDDSDPRYAGKKVSRKSVGFGVQSSDDESHPGSIGDSGVNPLDEDVSISAGSNVDDSEGSEGEEDNAEGSEEDVEDESEIEEDEDYSISQSQPSKDTTFRHLSSTNQTAEIDKGNAIRRQMALWDHLLECRIQLQKCLIAANRLPQPNIVSAFRLLGGAPLESAVEVTQKAVTGVLDKLLELRSDRLGAFPETRSLNTKKRKRDDYSALLDEQHREFVPYRNATIQKWNDKTRVSVGNLSSRNFSAFEQSTLRQVEQVLANRQRLVERTRMKRSTFRSLGSEPSEVVVDTEIFDDDDFYHQLLRELIERKAVDVDDPSKLGRQWIELQKLRSKMKRKVDTRATKGRKIRFTVHQKLVNFMAPVGEPEWNEEATAELFNSLFTN